MKKFYIIRVVSEFFLTLNIALNLSKNKNSFIILFFFSLIILAFEGYSLSIVFEVSNRIINDDFETKNHFLNFLEMIQSFYQ